jgi:hypothetical protein
MLFIDGENLTIRAQEFAERHALVLREGAYFARNIFVWVPNFKANVALTNTKNVSLEVQPHSIRSYYYTSLVGDESKILSVRRCL